MSKPALQIVPAIQPVIAPKFLNQLDENASLTEIYVYSQRDYATGSRVAEQGSKFNSTNSPMPAYGENDLIDLGGSYTQKQVCAALKKMKKDEAPEITQLRAHIVDQIELKKLFYTAVKNINQANKYGISFGDEFTGEFIEDHCIGIGVMALEHSAP